MPLVPSSASLSSYQYRTLEGLFELKGPLPRLVCCLQRAKRNATPHFLIVKATKVELSLSDCPEVECKASEGARGEDSHENKVARLQIVRRLLRQRPGAQGPH